MDAWKIIVSTLYIFPFIYYPLFFKCKVSGSVEKPLVSKMDFYYKVGILLK